MVSHASLVAEIDVVNNMPTEDRLIHARQRRVEQLQRWEENELKLEEESSNNHVNGDTARKKLVKFGESITLLEAAARDDIEEVQFLLKTKTNPDEANDDGLTALHQACIDNFEDMVQLLLNYGANVNAVDSEQWTPLHAACTCGHTNVAKILVQKGADLLALNADHNMPYDICEENETLDFIEKSMAAKGITQEQINTIRSSKERQIIKDMQTLLESGGDLNYQDESKATVLHIAAANGYLELSKFLLEHGSDTNIKDCDGWTPLHAASCWCQTDIVEMLGSFGADPTVKNGLGEIPADVTEDDEIKAMLVKIRSSQKDKTRRRLFPGLPKISGRNNSKRGSGMRGQSFKGRSKRDKKAGISTIEAKAEAQFWTGGQETDEANPAEERPNNNNHLHTNTFSDKADSNEVIGPDDVGLKLSSEPVAETEQSQGDKKNVLNNSMVEGSELSESGRSNNVPQSSVTQNPVPEKTQKKKKEKKAKKQAKPSKEDENRKKEKAFGSLDENGKFSGSLRNVIGPKKRYSLVESEEKNIIATANGSGKTLAEVKRQRSHEAEEKCNSSPGNVATSQSPDCPLAGEMSENIKQFKGHTNSELRDSISRKKKICIIL